jgi:hypothetical protein
MTKTRRDESFINPEFIGVNVTPRFILVIIMLRSAFPVTSVQPQPELFPRVPGYQIPDLPGSSPAPISFSSPSKIRFIHFYLTGKGKLRINPF